MPLKSLMHNSALYRLLALALLLASISIASHVHASHEFESHEVGEEQIENCFVYHQFPFSTPESLDLPSFSQFGHTFKLDFGASADIIVSALRPPARAPPLS